MISDMNISYVEGKIEPASLARQKFPRLNINLDSVNSTGSGVEIKYTFVADYFESEDKDAKNIGQIKLGGVVNITDSKENIAALMKRWNEKKTLPPQIAEEVLNALSFRCSASGTLMAYVLGLIPPLVTSTIKIQDTASK
ncbi:MAG: hypothetical protein ACP5RI_00975 [Candidatus Micrarchaeia archaeon]